VGQLVAEVDLQVGGERLGAFELEVFRGEEQLVGLGLPKDLVVLGVRSAFLLSLGTKKEHFEPSQLPTELISKDRHQV